MQTPSDPSTTPDRDHRDLTALLAALREDSRRPPASAPWGVPWGSGAAPDAEHDEGSDAEHDRPYFATPPSVGIPAPGASAASSALAGPPAPDLADWPIVGPDTPRRGRPRFWRDLHVYAERWAEAGGRIEDRWAAQWRADRLPRAWHHAPTLPARLELNRATRFDVPLSGGDGGGDGGGADAEQPKPTRKTRTSRLARMRDGLRRADTRAQTVTQARAAWASLRVTDLRDLRVLGAAPPTPEVSHWPGLSVAAYQIARLWLLGTPIRGSLPRAVPLPPWVRVAALGSETDAGGASGAVAYARTLRVVCDVIRTTEAWAFRAAWCVAVEIRAGEIAGALARAHTALPDEHPEIARILWDAEVW